MIAPNKRDIIVVSSGANSLGRYVKNQTKRPLKLENNPTPPPLGPITH